MAPPGRTFFIMLVTITGILYFLYTVYTSTLDGPSYRFGSWGKVLKNFSYSSSPLIQRKEEQNTNPNDIIVSISNMSNSVNSASNDNFSKASVKKNLNEIIASVTATNKTEESKSEVVRTRVDERESNHTGNREKEKSKEKVKEKAKEPKHEKEKEKAKEPKHEKNEKEKAKEPKHEKNEKEKAKEPKHEKNEKAKESFIQVIPPKTENVTVDYIVEGVITRTVYDSGFTLPNLELCPDFGKRLQVVIIITSAPKHAEARSAIRQTWGHYQLRKDIAIAFIVGRSPDVKESVIRQENDLYGDIIFANFVDSYNNLTLKTVSILEWVDNYCGQAKFVLKTDDDMFINIPKLLQFIGNHLKDKRKIFGKLAKKWKPIRKKTSKYYVSVKQYRNSLFPDFTTGPAYLMTSDVIHGLYVTALEKTYLKLEDVYTTGIVAQEERIQRVHVNEFFNRRITLSPCNVQKGISIHMIKPFEQYDLWKKLLDGRSKC